MTYTQKNLWVCVNGKVIAESTFTHSRDASIGLFAEYSENAWHVLEDQGWRCIHVNMELTEMEK